MASLHANLFRYKPDNVVVRNKTSYTVPAGYRALVTFFVAMDSHTQDSASTNYGYCRASVSRDSVNSTMEIWLKAGDTITASMSNIGSGLGSLPTVSVTIGGVTINTFRTQGFTSHDNQKDGIRPIAPSITNGADWGLIAYEFLN